MLRLSYKELRKLINPFALFTLILNLTRMLTGLICIRWVTPEQMGVWQIMIMIEGYLMFARFGIINALNRELPFNIGRNRMQKALKYLDVTESYVLLIATLFFLGLFISSFVYRPDVRYWQECIIALSLFLPIKFYSGFIELTYRSGSDFSKLVRVQIALIVFTMLSLYMVYLLGFEGYLIRIVFLAALGFVLLMHFRPFRFKPNIDLSHFVKLFKTGIPLFVSNYTQSVINTFPGLFLLQFGSLSSLGLYYPVSIVMNFGMMVPGIISTYLNPQTSFNYGANKNAGNVIRINERASLYSFIIMLPIMIIGFFLLPAIFSRFASEYVEALPASRLALIFALLSCTVLMMNPFAILKAWKPMYVYLAVSAILSWWIPYVMLTFVPGDSVVLKLVGSLLIVKILLIGVNYLCIRMIRKDLKS